MTHPTNSQPGGFYFAIFEEFSLVIDIGATEGGTDGNADDVQQAMPLGAVDAWVVQVAEVPGQVAGEIGHADTSWWLPEIAMPKLSSPARPVNLDAIAL